MCSGRSEPNIFWMEHLDIVLSFSVIFLLLWASQDGSLNDCLQLESRIWLNCLSLQTISGNSYHKKENMKRFNQHDLRFPFFFTNPWNITTKTGFGSVDPQEKTPFQSQLKPHRRVNVKNAVIYLKYTRLMAMMMMLVGLSLIFFLMWVPGSVYSLTLKTTRLWCIIVHVCIVCSPTIFFSLLSSFSLLFYQFPNQHDSIEYIYITGVLLDNFDMQSLCHCARE